MGLVIEALLTIVIVVGVWIEFGAGVALIVGGGLGLVLFQLHGIEGDQDE